MAEQITLKEVILFRGIKAAEFLKYKTKVLSFLPFLRLALTLSPSLLQSQLKKSYIVYMVNWFNVLSHSLANEVRFFLLVHSLY